MKRVMARKQKQIFHDKTGRRKQATNLFLALVTTSVILLLTVFIWSVVFKPDLPLAALDNSVASLSSTPKKLSNDISSEPKVNLGHLRAPLRESAVKAARYAFFVNWDTNSFASLKRNAAAIDVLLPEWGHVTNENATLKLNDILKQSQVTKWAQEHAPHLKISAVINNFDSKALTWNRNAINTILASDDLRKLLTENIHDYIEKSENIGASIDFREVTQTNKANYVDFIAKLHSKFERSGFVLNVIVPPASTNYDYDAIIENADHLIIRTIFEHGYSKKPGPLAGQGWFETMLDERFLKTQGDKIIVTIGSYGFDWADGKNGVVISVPQAWDRLKKSEAPLYFEPHVLNPGFTYINKQTNTNHEIWFLNGITAYNQTAAALAMEPGGLALWRLGTEEQNVWSILGRNRMPDNEAFNDLLNPYSHNYTLFKGHGEVFKVSSEGIPGLREIGYDPRHNLMTDQQLKRIPEPRTLTFWGGDNPKLLALTFDDGPDPTYTPKILDILAEKKVKASFFIIGLRAVSDPQILKRILDEGHDVGSHSFTHANMFNISDARVEFELNATQRLIESRLGVSTLLFRPPYAAAQDPGNPDKFPLFRKSTKLGYLIVNLNINPMDWLSATAETLAKRAITQVENGDGNILLLHDGGGNRTETVKALPIIIDKLRAKGYRFVTTHELIGSKRAEVMPASNSNKEIININIAGFFTFQFIIPAMIFLCITGIIIGTARLIFISLCALLHARREKLRDYGGWRPDSVSVIVPAYNEKRTVCATIRTILDSDFKNISEIIVVDDGSTDETFNTISMEFVDEPRVQIFSKDNGGKSSALNYGLLIAKSDILVTLDADTIFDKEAIGLLVAHFKDEKVGGVAGTTIVGNEINMITRFQSLEYVTSQNLDRRAQEMLGAITVIPGAIGAWRKQAVVEVGGFSSETLAEDADCTLSIERLGWKVHYEPRATAYTEAPETISSFQKQRFRWMYGTLQAAYKHRSAMLSFKTPGIGFFAIPNIFVFQFLFALVSPFIDLILLWSLIQIGHNFVVGGSASIPNGSLNILFYCLAFVVLEVAAAALAMLLDRRNNWWNLLPLVVVQRFCYRQLLYITALRAVLFAARGGLAGWGKLTRSGGLLHKVRA